ncbi:hypothetical protein ABW20_dc0105207 [Dactylellina cionopaga]|nr:hypothetical protein ABW20_dc0105207 [Dactylellina cionopaga]
MPNVRGEVTFKDEATVDDLDFIQAGTSLEFEITNGSVELDVVATGKNFKVFYHPGTNLPGPAWDETDDDDEMGYRLKTSIEGNVCTITYSEPS